MVLLKGVTVNPVETWRLKNSQLPELGEGPTLRLVLIHTFNVGLHPILPGGNGN
jgi:hypothetical protein